MDCPQLDSLYLTEEEYSTAIEQVRLMAYYKWLDAGSPEGQDFWREAELEWIEYCYVPDRYADESELHAMRDQRCPS